MVSFILSLSLFLTGCMPVIELPYSTQTPASEPSPIPSDPTDIIVRAICDDMVSDRILGEGGTASSWDTDIAVNEFLEYRPAADESLYKDDTHRESVIYINNTDYRISAPLYEKLYNTISGKNYTFTMYVCDLYTGMNVSFSPEEYIISASVIKAAMALYVIKLIEKGEASFDDRVTYNKKRHYLGGGGVLKYEPDGSVFTLRELLDKMITISDNVAYLMVHDAYDYKGYNEMIRELGGTVWLDSYTRFGYFTAKEMGSVWREIYRMSLTTESGKWLMDRLIEANHSFFDESLNDKYTIAHKAGWDVDAENECGIVFAEHPYAVCIMTDRRTNMKTSDIPEITSVLDEVMTEYFAWLKTNDTEQ